MRIGVVDYTVGNLGSLLAALRRAGAEPVVVNEPEEADGVDAIVLPGVGAYDAAAAKARSFKRVIESKPTLAICLGMQLLFEGSEEGAERGLGIFPGRAERIKAAKVPHIGWSYTRVVRPLPFLEEDYYYYLHSFGVPYAPDERFVAYVELQRPYVAAVYKEPILGVQFHPERSGKVGLALLRNLFATWRR